MTSYGSGSPWRALEYLEFQTNSLPTVCSSNFSQKRIWSMCGVWLSSLRSRQSTWKAEMGAAIHFFHHNNELGKGDCSSITCTTVNT